MERTVEIHIDFERLTGPMKKDVEGAVGYFALWSTYPVREGRFDRCLF